MSPFEYSYEVEPCLTGGWSIVETLDGDKSKPRTLPLWFGARKQAEDLARRLQQAHFSSNRKLNADYQKRCVLNTGRGDGSSGADRG
jgi:hypothetical protein